MSGRSRAAWHRIGIQVAWLALVFLMFPAALMAHAVVVDSSPRDGETLHRSPSHLTLRFNAKIETALSRMVLSGAGKVIKLSPSSANAGRGKASEYLVVALPRLTPGDYVLRYTILATDGHATPGILRFSISGGEVSR